MRKVLTTGFFALTTSLLLVAATVFLPVHASAQYTGGKADCGPIAMIYCGVRDLSELQQKYNEDQGRNLKATYTYFGISNRSAMDGMVKGRVTKSGEVWVGNEKVATDAITAGRKNEAGSIPILNGQIFMRPPSVSFSADSLEALIKMKDGRFQFAVIMSCGNPVKAKPVEKPKPKPQPQPTPEKPKFEIEKDVRVKGQTEWQQHETTAKPGDTVEFRITVKNTGEVDLQNVKLRDILPSGVSFTNSVDSHLFNEGISLGAIAAGASKETIFEVTVGQTLACEEGLINEARAKPDDATEQKDEASLKICQPQVAAAQTTKAQGGPTELIKAGPGGALGLFSISSVLGVALYKLKDFYAAMLG